MEDTAANAQQPRALNTRQRILEAALELFNQDGERHVTTNHIAAHLSISPGNLYYHFPNKQAIVLELFSQFEAWADQLLQRPNNRLLTIADKAFLLEALLKALWHYRFLHRDMQHLLAADNELAERYQALAQRCLNNAQAVYQGFADAGILQIDPEAIEALALNAWVIVTAWLPFVCSVQAVSVELTPAMLRRAIYQVLMLERGYVSAAARPEVDELLRRYTTPLNEVIPKPAVPFVKLPETQQH